MDFNKMILKLYALRIELGVHVYSLNTEYL